MEFLTYKTLYERDRAESLAQILIENGIEFELTENRESLDSLYGDKQFGKQFFIKIRQSDFEKADTIISKMSETELDTLNNDHYLFGFTDEELFDILSKPDEWNEVDYHLAKKILKERGKEITPDTIELLKKQRINELAKPEDGQKNWIYAGYIFSLLGGLLGIFIGWHLSSFKKTLPNGQQVYGYRQEDRRSGTRIMIIGSIMFIVLVTVRVMRGDY